MFHDTSYFSVFKEDLSDLPSELFDVFSEKMVAQEFAKFDGVISHFGNMFDFSLPDKEKGLTKYILDNVIKEADKVGIKLILSRTGDFCKWTTWYDYTNDSGVWIVKVKTPFETVKSIDWLTFEQDYLLTCLYEESSEIIKLCSKVSRFGCNEYHPDDPSKEGNLSKLQGEIYDFLAVLEMLKNGEHKLFKDMELDIKMDGKIQEHFAKKQQNVLKYIIHKKAKLISDPHARNDAHAPNSVHHLTNANSLHGIHKTHTLNADPSRSNTHALNDDACPSLYPLNDDIYAKDYGCGKTDKKQHSNKKTHSSSKIIIDMALDIGSNRLTSVDQANKFVYDILKFNGNSVQWWTNDQTFTLDFANVKSISPTFANKTFAYMHGHTNDKIFHRKFKFVNITKVKMATIEVEIENMYNYMENKKG